MLPGERAARPSKDAGRQLFEKSRCGVVVPELARVMVPFEPGGINEQAFGQLAFKVYSFCFLSNHI